jgi:hypothetical protein
MVLCQQLGTMTWQVLARHWQFTEAFELLRSIGPANDAERLELARLGRLAGKWQDALEAARAVQDAKLFAQAALLRASLWIEAGDTQQAIQLLRGMLADEEERSEGVIHSIRYLLREALARQHPHAAVVEVPNRGRCLVARCEVRPGDVVVQEGPVAAWSSGDRQDLTSKPFFYDFVGLNNIDQTTILDMCTLPQTPKDAVQLVAAVRRFKSSYAPAYDGMSIQALARLAIVEKLNAHTYHGGEGKSSALFDMMSKASHSCAPNCIYDATRCAYVALKPIREGEEIAFPYFARSALAQPAIIRSNVLQRTHQICPCLCPRCVSDRRDGDPCRGIICSIPRCRGSRYRREKPGAAAAIWECDTCHESWRDEEMPLSKEQALSDKVMALWNVRERPEKGHFERAKELLAAVSSTLGTSHWTYLFTLDVFQAFFFHIATKTAASTGDIARTCAATVVHKYIVAAATMRLHVHAPLLVAEMALSSARRLSNTSPHLRTDVVVLTLIGCRLADIGAVFPESVDADWLKAQSTDSKLFKGEIGELDPSTAWKCVEGGADVWRRAREDDADTLAVWEDHLTSRVVAEMRSSNAPRLPASIQQAMARS